jgi:hypothetical protein
MNEPVSTRAVFSLVFGILAFNGCPCVGSLLAIVLGWGERSGIGRAGVVLGWISLLMYVGIALLTAFFLLFAAFVDAVN